MRDLVDASFLPTVGGAGRGAVGTATEPRRFHVETSYISLADMHTCSEVVKKHSAHATRMLGSIRFVIV